MPGVPTAWALARATLRWGTSTRTQWRTQAGSLMPAARHPRSRTRGTPAQTPSMRVHQVGEDPAGDPGMTQALMCFLALLQYKLQHL